MRGAGGEKFFVSIAEADAAAWKFSLRRIYRRVTKLSVHERQPGVRAGHRSAHGLLSVGGRHVANYSGPFDSRIRIWWLPRRTWMGVLRRRRPEPHSRHHRHSASTESDLSAARVGRGSGKAAERGRMSIADREEHPTGAKAHVDFAAHSARLKSCPFAICPAPRVFPQPEISLRPVESGGRCSELKNAGQIVFSGMQLLRLRAASR
jgi:hypothetical protein